jgi:hypothetical protein
VHAVVGSFTPGNTSFLVINPDFHFGLAMDVIVCATDVGNVLRTSVGTSPTMLEAELLWSGLEFVVMVALSSKIVQGTLNAIKTILLILSFCPFCNSETLILSFNHDNARCHVARVCRQLRTSDA